MDLATVPVEAIMNNYIFVKKINNSDIPHKSVLNNKFIATDHMHSRPPKIPSLDKRLSAFTGSEAVSNQLMTF